MTVSVQIPSVKADFNEVVYSVAPLYRCLSSLYKSYVTKLGVGGCQISKKKRYVTLECSGVARIFCGVVLFTNKRNFLILGISRGHVLNIGVAYTELNIHCTNHECDRISHGPLDVYAGFSIQSCKINKFY